ncbi:MAG: hypothetical protein ACLR23_06695 [Clostridia bacterium]
MHAGEVKNDTVQRAHEDIFSAATVETTEPAEKRDQKCTPARRRTTPSSGHTEANSLHSSGETILPAEIQNDKCTPAWRRTTPASGHTEANSTPPAARRSCRRRYRMINARRRG